jgi:hypothetical protein
VSDTFHGITVGKTFGKPGPFLFASGSTLLDGLVSWWDLDETSGTRADAVGSNDLTDVNTVNSGTGKVGNASSHDRLNQEHLLSTTFAPLHESSDYAVSLWVKPIITNLDATYGGGVICMMDGSLPGSWAVSCNRNGDIFWYNWEDKTAAQSKVGGRLRYDTDIPNDTWAHIVVSRESGVGTLYHNGSVLGVAQTQDTLAWTDFNFSIGQFYPGITYCYEGLVDLVGYWDRALTSDEVTELYNLGASIKNEFTDNGEGFRQDMVAYYKMEEASGTRVNSAAPDALKRGLVSYWNLDEASGNRAPTFGGVTLTDNNTVGSAAGKSGNAATFTNGNNESLSLGADSFECETGGILTFSFWFKDTTAGVTTAALISRDDATTREYAVFTGNTVFQILAFDTDGTPVTLNSNTDHGDLFTKNTWYHAVVELNNDADTISYQINNGTKRIKAVAKDTRGGDAVFRVGHSTYYAAADLQVDELCVWRRLLAPDEVTALYASGAGTYYPFADASGIFDLSDVNTVDSATGISGTAASFQRENAENLLYSTPVLPNDSSFTVVMWIKQAADLPDSNAGCQPFKTNASFPDQHGALLEYYWTGAHRLYNRRGYGTWIEVGDNRGNWTMLVYQYDLPNTQTRCKLVGAAANDDTWTSWSAGDPSATNAIFQIGGNETPWEMDGEIDEAMIFTALKSDDEIAALYAAGAGRFYDFNTL